MLKLRFTKFLMIGITMELGSAMIGLLSWILSLLKLKILLKLSIVIINKKIIFGMASAALLLRQVNLRTIQTV